MLPPQGARVGSQVRALISHMTHGVAKKKKKTTQKNLLPLPTSSLAAGHYILPGGLSPPPPQSFEMPLRNALFPRHSFGHYVWVCIPIISLGGPQVSLTPSAHPSSVVPRSPHLVHPETCLPLLKLPVSTCSRGLRPNSSRWTANPAGLPVGPLLPLMSSLLCACPGGPADPHSH